MASLCRSLKIAYPIVQSGMGRVAGPDLVGAVVRAGGLGILAGLNLTPDDLRSQIRRVRQLTTGTFGVNLWLHPDLHPPVDPSAVPAEDVEAATAALNRARLTIGIPESVAAPLRRPDTIDDAFNVMLDEQVPVWSIGLGLPTADMLSRCHDRGVQVMVMVANVDDARTAADLGVDFIVAQGVEAGGHRSTWRANAAADVGTLALVPEVVDAVRVPVIAAGGIADGRGLVAALALGAAGVLMGTRFVATRESMAPEFWKQRILAATSGQTILTTAFTGLRARVLRSQFAEDYAASGAPVLPGLLQAALEQDIWAAASKENRPDYFPLYAGQSVGVIGDLPGAGDVVGAIVDEAKSTLTQLANIL
jgi:nitronate monooxygenase